MSEGDALVNDSLALAEDICSIPPTLSPDDVASQLDDLKLHGMNWQVGDDRALRRAVSALANRIDRMRRLKRGGVDAYEDPIRTKLRALLLRLAEQGLFLVPKGELEQWLSTHDVDVSPNDKRAWANAAAQKVQMLGRVEGDVWAFVSMVGSYLVSTARGALFAR